MKSLTAEALLAIPVDKPELLFTADADAAKSEYRVLVSKWHPDQNPMVDENVMAHVNVIYNLAVFRLSTDTWVTPGVVEFKTVDGKKFKFKYRSTRSFELGDIFVADNLVAYSLYKDNDDLYKTAQKAIKGFKYVNDDMRKEVSRFLPEIHSELETEDRLIMLIKKTPDQLLLSDVLEHYKDKMDPKHVAWIISRLYNIACYFKYANIVHSGIILDSIFISPEFHSVSVLGGWWYSAEKGKMLNALPGVAVEFAPDDVIDSQMADPKIDMELILAVGRQLLGDIVGSKLLMDKSIPTPLVTWLRAPSKGDALADYKLWQSKILIDSFGKRAYVELKLNAKDLYEG